MGCAIDAQRPAFYARPDARRSCGALRHDVYRWNTSKDSVYRRGVGQPTPCRDTQEHKQHRQRHRACFCTGPEGRGCVRIIEIFSADIRRVACLCDGKLSYRIACVSSTRQSSGVVRVIITWDQTSTSYASRFCWLSRDMRYRWRLRRFGSCDGSIRCSRCKGYRCDGSTSAPRMWSR